MVNRKHLLDAIVKHFSKSELAILCADIEQALTDVGIDLPISPDIVGGENLPAIAHNLIVYLESRGYLEYLVDQVLKARPNLDTGEAIDQPRKPFFDRIPPNRHMLYGRQVQVDQAVTALRKWESLLLHGMGGIGKTALAAEAATQLRDSRAFDNGVLWLSNVGFSTVEGICDAVARLLKVKRVLELSPAEKPVATYELLSTYSLLVVLDDIQDPHIALDFADQCIPPHVALLVTSRRRNASYDLDLQLRSLQEQASIDLFSGLAKVSSEDASVTKICKLLGHHPLALTVAATLAREEDIATGILYRRLSSAKSRVASLQRDGSGPPNRNIWASLKLSYDALPDPQRHVFTHLAACFGESTGLELLASICGLSQEECENVAGRLVAWSLVERSDDRYSMHSLVKDFGQEVLRREDRLQEVQEKIAAAMLPFVYRHLVDTYEDFISIATELDNLIGALNFDHITGSYKRAQRLAAVVTRAHALDTLGYWSEHLTIGELGIKASDGANDQGLCSDIMNNTAIVYARQGNYGRARELHQRSLEIKIELGDPGGIANSLHNLGSIEQEQGNYERARELSQQSLDIRKELGDEGRLAIPLHQLGTIELDQGNYERARELLQEALDILRKLDNQIGIALSLHQLGLIEQFQGNNEQARDLFEQSLDLDRKLGNQAAIASTLQNIGILEQHQGNYEQARELFQQSLDIARKLGDQAGVADSLGQLGVLALDQEDKEEARRLFHAALEVYDRLKSPYAELTRQNLAMLDEPS